MTRARLADSVQSSVQLNQRFPLPEAFAVKRNLVSSLALMSGLVIAGAAIRPAVAQVTSPIPDAIVGKAPPPSGQTVTYLPGDAATKGYSRYPKVPGRFRR